MKKTISIISLTTIAAIGVSVSALAYSPVNSQLDLGSRGSDVTNLQEYFTSMPSIYPEGLVTGYFGNLTRTAVIRFQAANGIAQVGRVGPETKAKINFMMGGSTSGGNTSINDMSAPLFSNVTSSRSNNTLGFTLNTNENTNVRAVYSTSPIMFNEGDSNGMGFQTIGGTTINSSSNMSTYHTVNVGNLMNNATYYVTMIATDGNGNVSVFGPNTMYTTSQ